MKTSVDKTLVSDDGLRLFVGVDNDAEYLMLHRAFPHLCVKLGLKFSWELQHGLPDFEWAIASPLFGDKWLQISDHGIAIREDSSVKSLRSQGIGRFSPELTKLSGYAMPMILVDRDLSWRDGPYLTAEGQSVEIFGEGLASLCEWARRNSFSDAEAKLVHMYCRSPSQLRREVHIPNLIA